MPKLKAATILPTPAEDIEVVEKFRASGDGWQTRMNDVLKSWVRNHA